MQSKYKMGDVVYFVESNRFIREAKIIRCSGGLYLLRFTEGGGTQVKEHRLFRMEEEAQAEIDRYRSEMRKA